MDKLIRRFDAVADGDLMLCHARGVAYQRDMTTPIRYDDKYFQHYADLEGKVIARKLNAGRVAMVNKYVDAEHGVLDVGVGSGEFVRARDNTWGFDINPRAIELLKRINRWTDSLAAFDAFTFWDVLEHIPEPEQKYFKKMADDCYLFTSLPIFTDLTKVRASKHYKPNEHFYYWTEQGFIDWMAQWRFRLLERSTFETEAGREGITSFAFKRDMPGYHKTLEQYQNLHARFYGSSAHLHFEQISKVVLALNPRSVIDFGCGRSDLVSYFWKDGARRVAKYDPAIPQYKQMPDGHFDLLLCTDVMEHIPMTDVDKIFDEMKTKADKVLFTISMKPARAKLPDGRNAHVTLLTRDEWLRWISASFGRAVPLPMEDAGLLMVKTF